MTKCLKLDLLPSIQYDAHLVNYGSHLDNWLIECYHHDNLSVRIEAQQFKCQWSTNQWVTSQWPRPLPLCSLWTVIDIRCKFVYIKIWSCAISLFFYSVFLHLNVLFYVEWLINACVWHGNWVRPRERETLHKAFTAVLVLTRTHKQIHTFSTYTLSHINTLNWGSGYTVTHLAALWAKGCDEPWKNLLSPSHTHSLRQSETDTGRGWLENNSENIL